MERPVTMLEDTQVTSVTYIVTKRCLEGVSNHSLAMATQYHPVQFTLT